MMSMRGRPLTTYYVHFTLKAVVTVEAEDDAEAYDKALEEMDVNEAEITNVAICL